MAYTRCACRTTIIAALALAVLATEASAQKSGGGSTTFYNTGGQNLGRGATAAARPRSATAEAAPPAPRSAELTRTYQRPSSPPDRAATMGASDNNAR